MAKWGEGDPRWIVEERADAKNVKNWHWTEKNATSWSIEQINKLLLNVHIEDNECKVMFCYYGSLSVTCNITKIPKCEGEAFVNNRKAKLIFLYEWQIEIEWTGKRKTGNNEVTGMVEVYLGEEYSIEETEFKVSCSSSTTEGDALKKYMQTKGVEVIRNKLAHYLKILKEEYSRSLILPTKEETNNSVSTANQTAVADSKVTGNVREDSKVPRDLSSAVLSFTEEFFCTPDDLYRVLTTKELVQAFTRDAAVVDAKINGEYRIFGGNITGIFDSLDPGKVIEMRWRKENWTKNHYSNLTLHFSPFENGTRMTLTQTNVPNYDLENTTNGWKANFFLAVKQTFGYGNSLIF